MDKQVMTVGTVVWCENQMGNIGDDIDDLLTSLPDETLDDFHARVRAEYPELEHAKRLIDGAALGEEWYEIDEGVVDGDKYVQIRTSGVFEQQPASDVKYQQTPTVLQHKRSAAKAGNKATVGMRAAAQRLLNEQSEGSLYAAFWCEKDPDIQRAYDDAYNNKMLLRLASLSDEELDQLVGTELSDFANVIIFNRSTPGERP